MKIAALILELLQSFNYFFGFHICRISRNNILLLFLHRLDIFFYFWKSGLHLFHLLHFRPIGRILLFDLRRLAHSLIKNKEIGTCYNHNCKENEQQPLI